MTANRTIAWVCMLFFLVISSVSADEFTQLFNGTNLDGWEVKEGPDSIWTVEDSMIVCKGSGHPRGWLGTTGTYRNFVLTLEWKIAENGNSGVFLRVGDDPDQNPAYDAIEIQIVDDHGTSYVSEDRNPLELSGGIYAVVGPDKDMYTGTMEWNTYVITCDEYTLSVEYNNEVVLDIDMRDYAQPFVWFNRERPGLISRPHEGYIALQTHGSPAYFRNISIKVLE